MKGFDGTKTLKTILQLIRYDIPPLIVGKSSIGKSYTLIEITKKWRIPNSILYIGSEKSENIEGIAKLVSNDYDKDGEDILKFLKPYWFPNTNTITSQVSNGRKIFEKYIKSYDNKQRKFSLTYECLHQILVSLMEVDYESGESIVKVSLRDSGRSYISNITSDRPETLNSKPFEFQRSQVTVLQEKTAKVDTLNSKEAGRDDLRDLCMYLTTILGYGNYWLILDELDKVDKFSQDKYAPLLHIVRERTLKNWNLREINDKKGVGVPLMVENEYYESIVNGVNAQIDRGLSLMDCRVIGIANASKEIENALFRRFCQILMEDTMALYPPDNNANQIIMCVEKSMSERNLVDSDLLIKIASLDDINLQWQYSFFPRILNNTDRISNYFIEDFNQKYQEKLKEYGNEPDAAKSMLKNIMTTAFGKMFSDNFFIGDKDEEEIKELQEFLKCVFPMLLEGAEISTPLMAGQTSTAQQSTSPVQGIREMLIELKQDNPDERMFWRQLEKKIEKEFKGTEDGSGFVIAKLNNWTKNSLNYILAANQDADEGYNSIEDVGGEMIGFIYRIIIKNLNSTYEVDADLFNSQMRVVEAFFDKLLNREGEEGTHTLGMSEESAQTLLYGATKKEFRGMREKDVLNASIRSLYGKPGDNNSYLKSLSNKTYVSKYLMNELTTFFKIVLNDTAKFDEFQENASKKNSVERRTLNYLKTPKVKDVIQDLYTQTKQGGMTRELKNIEILLKLNK